MIVMMIPKKRQISGTLPLGKQYPVRIVPTIVEVVKHVVSVVNRYRQTVQIFVVGR